jgi:hypothetical protein
MLVAPFSHLMSLSFILAQQTQTTSRWLQAGRLLGDGTAYGAIPAAALLFLLVDIYPVVRSFSATFRTASFWILFVIFCVFNSIAYGAIRIADGQVAQKVGQGLGAALALVALATLGTIGVMQSLTLKISGYTFVDVGKWMDAFRGRVLEDISRRFADDQRLSTISLANKLSVEFAEYPAALRGIYVRLMMFGGRTPDDISKELDSLEKQTENSHLSFVEVLSTRIAQVDSAAARRLLAARRHEGQTSSTTSTT